MSYDNFDFDIEKVLIFSKTIRKKDERIQYLQAIKKEYQDNLTDAGHTSHFCGTVEDTIRPECGGDDIFVTRIHNEIEFIKIQKDKYKRRIAHLNEIIPDRLYPRKTMAELGGCSLSAIEKWVKFGKQDANGKAIFLEATNYHGESRILGQHFLNFIKETKIKEESEE